MKKGAHVYRVWCNIQVCAKYFPNITPVTSSANLHSEYSHCVYVCQGVTKQVRIEIRTQADLHTPVFLVPKTHH